MIPQILQILWGFLPLLSWTDSAEVFGNPGRAIHLSICYQVIVSLHARNTQCLDRSGLYPGGGHILVLLELLPSAYQDSPG